MRYMKCKKGFTLLEVIISVAIFAIVSVALISAFSNGMINIYASGNKTRAVEQVQGYMDSVWEASRNGSIKTATLDTDIKNILVSGTYSDPSNLFLSEGKDMKFYYKTDEVINGRNYTEITIVVFYQNKNRNVSLTSIIPVGGL